MIIGLAPMDGFTDYAFRQITKEVFEKYGDKNKYQFILRTEFMNANGYLINPVGVVKHLLSNKEQAPLIAQIFGNDKDILVKCFEDIDRKYRFSAECRVQNAELSAEAKVQNIKKNLNSELYTINSKLNPGQKIFSGLELNLGCPAKTVIQNGGGSAMLKDRTQVLEILKEIKKQTTLPLSIKTRTGITDDDKVQQKDFLIQASKICGMMTIHGRTVKQVYSGDADWAFMYDIKKNISKTCLLLGNGGVTNYEEIEAKKGNLDGILIGQAAIGNPRVFTPHVPSNKELKETILRHLELMVRSEQYFQEQSKTWSGVLNMPEVKKLPKIQFPVNEQIVVAFRKHLFQYIKGITGSKEWKRTISVIKDYEELVEAIEQFLT
ncbi:MAG: tRNA-dihydrouridine synthase [candidate division SR1 bacterium]|nr:tRNA-dihydrouridine synthase [candidate division SR1 bacterium]